MLIFCALLSAKAQGTFQNLDFEQANIVPVGGSDTNLVEASAALPYWSVYVNSNPQTSILYDTATAGGPAVSIQDSLSPVAQVLQGNYSVLLQVGVENGSSVAIGQTAQLPQDAASIIFYTEGPQNLQLTFASNLIPLVQIGATASHSIFSGDISSYAGQSGELRFTATYFSSLTLDNIQFVPEPSAFVLFAFGGLFFGLCRWCSHGSLPPG